MPVSCQRVPCGWLYCEAVIRVWVILRQGRSINELCAEARFNYQSIRMTRTMDEWEDDVTPQKLDS